jgi:hypothetical protein
MPAWDIDPAGVSGVVNRTRSIAEEFEGHLTAIDKALAGAAYNSSSTIVTQALADYATSSSPDTQFVVHRTDQTTIAAIEATNAYVRGDLEMAATAERSATAAAPADDMQAAPGSRPR